MSSFWDNVLTSQRLKWIAFAGQRGWTESNLTSPGTVLPLMGWGYRVCGVWRVWLAQA